MYTIGRVQQTNSNLHDMKSLFRLQSVIITKQIAVKFIIDKSTFIVSLSLHTLNYHYLRDWVV